MIFWWDKKKVDEIFFSIITARKIELILALDHCTTFFLPLCSWVVIDFFFRTRASTVIPIKWCKAFEALT